MKGATFDEFKTMLSESWEIDFLYKGHEYHYQRNGSPSGFDVYLTQDGRYVYEVTTDNMDRTVSELMGLKIYDGLALEDAEKDIVVLFEA